MGQRSHREERCKLHLPRCICDQIPVLTVTTQLIVVMHHREQNRPTATAPLAMRALTNHSWLIHGRQDAPVDLREHVGSNRRGLLLFPAHDARPLTPELVAEDLRPVSLVVPDGSWRQASKAARRLPGIETLQAVTLPPGPPSRYRLRREPRADGLATFEAIARAFGALEGPLVQDSLETLFEAWTTQMLLMRQAAGA
jgi:DTW domain-containing protein YfiP